MDDSLGGMFKLTGSNYLSSVEVEDEGHARG